MATITKEQKALFKKAGQLRLAFRRAWLKSGRTKKELYSMTTEQRAVVFNEWIARKQAKGIVGKVSDKGLEIVHATKRQFEDVKEKWEDAPTGTKWGVLIAGGVGAALLASRLLR